MVALDNARSVYVMQFSQSVLSDKQHVRDHNTLFGNAFTSLYIFGCLFVSIYGHMLLFRKYIVDAICRWWFRCFAVSSRMGCAKLVRIERCK